MQKIADTSNVVTLDEALSTLAAQARTRYAGEHGRIDKGVTIARTHGVTFLPDGTALVQSQSDAEIVYKVKAGRCDCPDAERAPAFRCKHRWAACLTRKAQQQALRYFATYTDPAGDAHQGIATRTGMGWLFVAEDGLDPLYTAGAALVLGGNVALYECQRAQDGDLVRKVCGY